MLTRRDFIALSGSGLVLMATPARAGDIITIGGSAFGSYWRLSLEAGSFNPQVEPRLSRVINKIDSLFSPYRAYSDITVFNRSANTDWLPVTEPLHALLSHAMGIACQSGGAFDPTVGPSVARFGFGPIVGENGRLDELDLMPGAVRKHRGGLTIDLCGIAKGRALDLMSVELAAAGIKDYLLDLSGEVASKGQHPAGRNWQVGVEAPVSGGLAHVLEIGDLMVATSGVSAQAYQVGQTSYGHIIYPATGEPVNGRTLSVSVVAGEAAHADAWATALMAAPAEDAIALAENAKLDALFLLRDGNATQSVFIGSFENFVRA